MKESEQQVAASMLGEMFTQLDPSMAEEWIASLPEGPVKDIGIRSAIENMETQDTAKSFQFAESIGDSSLRQITLRNALIRWRRDDPDKALQALEQTQSLDEDQKAKIKELLDRLPLRSESGMSTETNYVFPETND